MDYLLLRFTFKRFVLNPNKINPGDLLRSLFPRLQQNEFYRSIAIIIVYF